MKPGIAYIGGLLWLPREHFDSRQMRGTLTFIPNTMGLGKQRKIFAWADSPYHIGVPLYTLGDLHGEQFRRLFTDAGIPVEDIRPKTFEDIDIHSKVILDHDGRGDVQQRAASSLIQAESGVLCLACGMGKTTIALHAASQFKHPFIVIVDNKGLQEAWAEEARRHLMTSSGRPPEIGYVGDGREQWNRPVVIAIINSLARHAKSIPFNIRKRFCVAIFDECQMLGSPEFNKSAPLFMGRRWGLSATPKRADGLEKMYYLHIGGVVFTDLMQEMKPTFYFYKTKTKVKTDDPTFRRHVCLNGEINVSALFTYLAGIRERTVELLTIIHQGINAERKILVLSRRLFLLEQLKSALPSAGYVWSGVSGRVREEIIKNKDVILCQMRLGERALNKPDLDMLLVCEPVKRDAVFQQIVGRVQRHRPGKPVPIVIFVEDNVGPCVGMCRILKRYITNWPISQGGPYEWKYTHP